MISLPQDPVEMRQEGLGLADAVSRCESVQKPLPVALDVQLGRAALLGAECCLQEDVVSLWTRQ